MTAGTQETTVSRTSETPVVDQVRETADQVREAASRGVGQQLDVRTSRAGEEIVDVADALRRTGQQLRMEGREQPASMVEWIAARGERLGRYLEETDADRMLHDVEGFARTRPLLVTTVAFAGGVVASRVLKAGSRRRHAAQGVVPGKGQVAAARAADAGKAAREASLPAPGL